MNKSNSQFTLNDGCRKSNTYIYNTTAVVLTLKFEDHRVDISLDGSSMRRLDVVFLLLQQCVQTLLAAVLAIILRCPERNLLKERLMHGMAIGLLPFPCDFTRSVQRASYSRQVIDIADVVADH